MQANSEYEGDFLPPNPIRVETALSRYPVHRLAKHGDIAIDIREVNGQGELSIKWEVTHNSKYGHPGPLAYKLDTLLINRRIEEATRPIPKVLRLGSLREVTAELGVSTHATNQIRNALRQNASAFIVAIIKYKLSDGTTKNFEGEFTRYSVVLTGEELPDGRKADAVYIVLNDVYMMILNGAMTRPLDYDYLKSLPPASQRFYELLSFQMYAAIKNDRPRAKLLYSELCTYAPLVRQTDWNVVRPQLARIHAPHKQSGYIAKIDVQDVFDGDGKPDWMLLYQPGPKARAEHRAFSKKGGPAIVKTEPLLPDPLPLLPSPEPSPLEADLVKHGITPTVAAELVRQHGEEKVALQVEHLEWLNKKKPGKVAEPGAWLRMAITNEISLPKGFELKAVWQKREEAKQAKAREADELKRKEREKEATAKAELELIDAQWNSLSALEQIEWQARADALADPKQLAEETGPFKKMGQIMRRRAYIRQWLQDQGKLPAPKAQPASGNVVSLFPHPSE